MKFKGSLFFASLLLLSLSFASCKKDREILLDASESLALAYDVSWAVVIDSYALFRKECDWNAEGAGYCRKATVLQVIGKFLSPEGNWYKFADGWLPETVVSVYNNKLKAETAASLLR